MNGKALLIFIWFLIVQLAVSAPASADPDSKGAAEAAFSPIVRGTPVTWPEAFAPHPGHRLEWWYLTANLKGPDGTPYGLQWTLFRTALWPQETPQPRHTDGNNQVWFANAGLTRAQSHHAAERWVRGGLGLAGSEGLTAYIDNWTLQPKPGGTLTATGDDFSYTLTITDPGTAVLHGDKGYSEKAASGQASHYISLPRILLEGTIHFGDTAIPVRGEGWLDREWSSEMLARTQIGWDWFALSLKDGRKLMLFRVRGHGGEDYYSGTLISPDLQARPIPASDIRLTPTKSSPYGDGTIPTSWRVALPKEGLDLEVSALNPGSVMDLTIRYFEGPVMITGSHDGEGYLEMTGY